MIYIHVVDISKEVFSLYIYMSLQLTYEYTYRKHPNHYYVEVECISNTIHS